MTIGSSEIWQQDEKFLPTTMKFSNVFNLLTDLWLAISIALLPTLKDIFQNPSLLFRPQSLSRVFMANVWVVFGDYKDQSSKDVKKHLITPNAYGSVLDIGAGSCFFLS